MTAKDLEYYIPVVNKALAGIEKIHSNFERSSLWVNPIKQHHTLQRNHLWKEDVEIDVENFTVVLF